MSAHTAQSGHSIVAEATDAIQRWIENSRRFRRQRQAFVTTRDELRALSDRELSDIGLRRVDINQVAREAAADK